MSSYQALPNNHVRNIYDRLTNPVNCHALRVVSRRHRLLPVVPSLLMRRIQKLLAQMSNLAASQISSSMEIHCGPGRWLIVSIELPALTWFINLSKANGHFRMNSQREALCKCANLLHSGGDWQNVTEIIFILHVFEDDDLQHWIDSANNLIHPGMPSMGEDVMYTFGAPQFRLALPDWANNISPARAAGQ